MSRLDFGPMAPLPSGKVRWLVVHTEGSPGGAHGSVESIHRYHLSRGFAGGGYHRVIYPDGSDHELRPERAQGAHVQGLNGESLGVCCTGNGDLEDFTLAQKGSLAVLLATWMERYQVPIGRVIGHREAYAIPGVPDTGKTCPGRLVDMPEIRVLALESLLGGPPVPRLAGPTLSPPEIRR